MFTAKKPTGISLCPATLTSAVIIRNVQMANAKKNANAKINVFFFFIFIHPFFLLKYNPGCIKIKESLCHIGGTKRVTPLFLPLFC